MINTRHAFVPESDITPYELAVIVSADASCPSEEEKLTFIKVRAGDKAMRHFTVVPKRDDKMRSGLFNAIALSIPCWVIIGGLAWWLL